MTHEAFAVLLALLVAMAQPSLGMVFTNQFQQWYPQYGFIFEEILHTNCTVQYAKYLTGYQNQSDIDWFGGGGTISVLTQPVTLCILNGTSDYVKSIMASAQVLLGVMPTILALIGPSTEELALLTVVARRPLLALLLALGCPSVYLSRAFEYRDPDGLLQDRKDRLRQWRPFPAAQWTISFCEYALAIMAVVNTALLDWDLGIKTICSFLSDTVIAPTIWGLLAVAIHIVGTITLRLRVRREYGPRDAGEGTTFTDWLWRTPDRLKEICRWEFIPSVAQGSIRVKTFPETKTFIFLAWFLSPGIICHIIFGTILMSSLTFIGPKDAFGVVGRYMLSVLACRIILMYEIAGLREGYIQAQREDGQVFQVGEAKSQVRSRY
ncbi:hypothetical protein F4810DRAFT_664254 [Camillea tinctor]|nr:hypothetical protein F4810DRAFT_664254 [Camillea tinctor]